MTAFFRRIVFAIVGVFVTPSLIRHVFTESIAQARALAAKTDTPLDDVAVDEIEHFLTDPAVTTFAANLVQGLIKPE